jgi:formiminotetrahydrofolate cyclodeaminase
VFPRALVRFLVGTVGNSRYKERESLTAPEAFTKGFKGTNMSGSFITQLAQPQPVPGGGGAAAHAACVALGLLEKIVRLEVRRIGHSPEQSLFWTQLLDKTKSLADRLMWLRDEDGRAYMGLAEAKTPGGQAWTLALHHATDCPVMIVENICNALGPVMETGRCCSRRLLSDLLAVCEILNGAGNAVYHIAVANIKLMSDYNVRNSYSKKLEDHTSSLHEKYRETTRFLISRL